MKRKRPVPDAQPEDLDRVPDQAVDFTGAVNSTALEDEDLLPDDYSEEHRLELPETARKHRRRCSSFYLAW